MAHTGMSPPSCMAGIIDYIDTLEWSRFAVRLDRTGSDFILWAAVSVSCFGVTLATVFRIGHAHYRPA